jgi:hypothetical protein
MTKRKSAKTKQKISRGLKEYWDEKGRSQATKLGATLALGGTALYAAKKSGLNKTLVNKASDYKNLAKQKIGDEIEERVYRALRDPYAPETFIGNKIAKGAKRGITEREITRARDTFKNTKEAFQKGADSTQAISVNDPNYRLGQSMARLYKRIKKRAAEDTKKLGFNKMNDNILSFEPSSDRRNEFWLEFSARKSVPQSKALSAEHRAAISQGLQEYYDKNPKPKQRDVVVDIDRLSRSINRLARAGNTALNIVDLADSLIERRKYRGSRRAKFDNSVSAINAASGALLGTSRAVGSIGDVPSKFLNPAVTLNKLKNSGKERELKRQVLEVRKEANKTNRQVNAVRARLERAKLERKDRELNIRSEAKDFYGTLVNTSAQSNRPGGTKFEEMRTRRAKLDGNAREYLGVDLEDLMNLRKQRD